MKLITLQMENTKNNDKTYMEMCVCNSFHTIRIRLNVIMANLGICYSMKDNFSAAIVQ